MLSSATRGGGVLCRSRSASAMSRARVGSWRRCLSCLTPAPRPSFGADALDNRGGGVLAIASVTRGTHDTSPMPSTVVAARISDAIVGARRCREFRAYRHLEDALGVGEPRVFPDASISDSRRDGRARQDRHLVHAFHARVRRKPVRVDSSIGEGNVTATMRFERDPRLIGRRRMGTRGRRSPAIRFEHFGRCGSATQDWRDDHPAMARLAAATNHQRS